MPVNKIVQWYFIRMEFLWKEKYTTILEIPEWNTEGSPSGPGTGSWIKMNC